jgi:hypothetical protein
MYKDVLRTIENVSFYPIFSFILFFTLFCLILFWVFTYDRKTIRKMESLPLDHNQPSDNIETKEI